MTPWMNKVALLMLATVLCARSQDATRMVDAGGYKIRMRVEGSGRPVAFIYGGFGGRLEGWNGVASKLKGQTQVILYDRGGNGQSEAAPGPRDSKHIAAELRAALVNAGVKGPWVIVGQSLGGIHARVFAHEYPKDVTGLVLIDPTAENYGDELRRVRTGLHGDTEPVAADELKSWPSGMRLEYESLNADMQQAREAWPLPKVPITVLTSLHAGGDLNYESPMLWLALHQELAKRAGAKHIVSETLGHNMQNEDPEFVAAAIRELVK
jgi:pimeloyl-ACP methyl ester carboxylesterase